MMTSTEIEEWILERYREGVPAGIGGDWLWGQFVPFMRTATTPGMSTEEESQLQVQFFDVWFDLGARGIVRPLDCNGRPWGLTPFGRAIVRDGWEAAIASPTRYERRLLEQAPAISDIALLYAAEGLRAFHAGLLISTAIAIGAAAERCILDLAAAYALFDPQAPQSIQSPRSIKTTFDELNKRITATGFRGSVIARLQAKGLPTADVQQHFIEFGTMVARIFDLYRITRNDAGHPIDPVIDRETLGALLGGFIRFARTVYLLADAMKNAA